MWSAEWGKGFDGECWDSIWNILKYSKYLKYFEYLKYCVKCSVREGYWLWMLGLHLSFKPVLVPHIIPSPPKPSTTNSNFQLSNKQVQIFRFNWYASWALLTILSEFAFVFVIAFLCVFWICNFIRLCACICI